VGVGLFIEYILLVSFLENGALKYFYNGFLIRMPGSKEKIGFIAL
jgi:hypothetical protein